MKQSHHNHTNPFSFDLLFEADSLTGASAHVILRFCSEDEDGTTYLTPDCKTPEEFHYQIDRLQSELERLRDRGIRGFIDAINGSKKRKRGKK